jgi:single-strand DNA-binding protein
MATRSWNRVELIGNVVRDPEMKYTPNGAAVTTFSVATNRTYNSDGEKKEETDFHRIVAWNKLAEICNQFMKKGTKVFVSGRLQNRQWEDQQTGQTRYMTEIVLEDMVLLPSGGGMGGGASSYNDDMQDDVNAGPPDDSAKTASKTAKPEPKKSEADDVPAREDVGDLDDLPF